MSGHRYLKAAQNAMQVVPTVLIEHGLQALVNRNVLSETDKGAVWLFIVLDNSMEGYIHSYAADSLLADLSRALEGHRVLFSHSFGLRFAVLLSA